MKVAPRPVQIQTQKTNGIDLGTQFHRWDAADHNYGKDHRKSRFGFVGQILGHLDIVN